MDSQTLTILMMLRGRWRSLIARCAAVIVQEEQCRVIAAVVQNNSSSSAGRTVAAVQAEQ